MEPALSSRSSEAVVQALQAADAAVGHSSWGSGAQASRGGRSMGAGGATLDAPSTPHLLP